MTVGITSINIAATITRLRPRISATVPVKGAVSATASVLTVMMVEISAAPALNSSDEFVGPLDGNGHIDAALWKQHRHSCGVRRFWKGEPNEHCLLVHRPGGPDYGRWVFDYGETEEDDDESGYRFGAHVFHPGEYVRVLIGILHTIRS
ncbi:MAG TPA: hypothetical protein VKE53_10435 [Pseudolabrys sp.]|nr:hypothetical protein [Pseudolabrys sp.]